MPTTDTRASGLDRLANTGNPVQWVFTWPTGFASGKTFTATVGSTSITPGVAGDVVTVSVSGVQTTALGNGRHALKVYVDGVLRIFGRLLLGETSTDSPTSTAVTVTTTDSVAVTVTVASGGLDLATVQDLIDDLVAGAPGALDTLNELAAALGDDANFATTVTNALANKQPLDADLTTLAGGGSGATAWLQALLDGTYASVVGGALSVNGAALPESVFPATLARDSEVAAGYVPFADPTMGLWYLDAFSGTDDQKMQAALAAWAANAKGGEILLPARTLSMTSAWTIPNDGAGSPQQKTLRFLGRGASHNGAGAAPNGGTIVDFTYNGAGPAKIDTRGHGLIHLADITFRDTSGGALPFFQTTNTTPIIERCEFYGSKTGTACDQDAIVLGGGTRNIDTSSTAKFDGYKPIVRDCHFHHVRRCVWLRPGCNDGLIEGNTIWSTCGAPDGTYGAIDLIGSSVGSIVGNVIRDNTIEVSKYVNAVLVGAYSKVNFFLNNGLYDPTATTVQGFYFDDNAVYNTVVAGYSDDSFTHMVESAAAAGKNTFITAHQSQQTQWAQPIKFLSTAGFGTEAVELLVSGGDGKFLVRPSAAAGTTAKLAAVKRSAAESSSPDTYLWYLLNGGGMFISDAVATPGTPSSGIVPYASSGKPRWKTASTADQVTGSTPDEVARSILAKLVTMGLLSDGTTAYNPAPDVLAAYLGVLVRSGQLNALSAGTRILLEGTAVPLVATGNSGGGVFYWDPADYAVTGHTTKLRIRLSIVTNDTAPACDFTVSLRAVSSPAGAASNVSFTAGSAISGTSVAVSAPAANSLNHSETADFDVPVAGFYAIAIVTSGAMAANSSVIAKATMQVKNI